MSQQSFEWVLPFVAIFILAASPPTSAAAAAAAETATTEDQDALAQPSKGAPKASGNGLRIGLSPLMVEVASLSHHPHTNSTTTLRSQWFATMKASASIDWRASIRADVQTQQGDSKDINATEVRLGETYVRWRFGEDRLTVGLQTVTWGRVDGSPLIDRVSRVDLRRFVLDDLKDRRLAQPSIRWEHEWGDLKTDFVWLAGFQSTLMPVDGSVWHPVNRENSQILGIAPLTGMASYFATAPLSTVDHSSGGAAVRITHAGDPFDWGLTFGKVRQPLPYFQLDIGAGRIMSSQPYNRFLAVDFEISGKSTIWRGELSYTRDVPMTSLAGQMLHASSVELAGGVEFFPGGRDTRVNLQLLARSVRVGRDTYELTQYSSINGEIETNFQQGQWRAALRFASALNIRDTYFSPRLTYTAWEPHELYVAAHIFSGEPQGFGGFMRNSDSLTVGLRTRF